MRIHLQMVTQHLFTDRLAAAPCSRDAARYCHYRQAVWSATYFHARGAGDTIAPMRCELVYCLNITAIFLAFLAMKLLKKLDFCAAAYYFDRYF